MILREFSRPVKCVDFDPDTGSGGDRQPVEGRQTAGFCEETEVGWVGIYPDREGTTLLVQIDGTTWDLYGEQTNVHYFHQYNDEETKFQIRDGENEFEHRYTAWWKDVVWFEPNRMAASREPENAEEDVFGYIHFLWEHEYRKDDFIKEWANNHSA